MYRINMNLPKRSKLIMLSGLALLLFGSSFIEKDFPVDEALLVTESMVREQNDAVKVTNKAYEKSYNNDNKMLCLNLVYRYPVLAGKSAAIRSINKQIEAQRDQWITSQKELIETAKQDNLVCNTNGNEVNYGVTYNENDILSILFEGYLYAGGAHGMPYRMPQTFQISTGKLLSLKDITRMNEKELREKVVGLFKGQYDKNPDLYWDNSVELVRNLPVEKYSYYVEQDGIHVYFDPYFVAPYAAGFVEIIL